jgi:hypothetical protein
MDERRGLKAMDFNLLRGIERMNRDQRAFDWTASLLAAFAF